VALEPVSVALKFGFLVVLYLFLLWVARSAMKDLRGAPGSASPPPDATGLHPVAGAGDWGPHPPHPDGRLVVDRAPGHEAGMIYDIGEGAILGRGDAVDIRLEDPFASSRHARLLAQGGIMVLEDLHSTNGTYLNEELVQGPRPLHAGDRVRIGDSEFVYEQG
jgi:hypothetical protein